MGSLFPPNGDGISMVETCKLNATVPQACLIAKLQGIVDGHKQS